ncbi:hypothetical protein BT93_L2871 [Corymbia citriodora subsp. variegata]|uniref:Uncharacterized protein n=1 Tax=Corymbia citriodora subsp. variegata TaxID=360336 RepID=A0A8T0CN88_CORYI|nr:hypothetical protein BT93_L2871 [Corymbia citriodora subsp. variegata]
MFFPLPLSLGPLSVALSVSLRENSPSSSLRLLATAGESKYSSGGLSSVYRSSFNGTERDRIRSLGKLGLAHSISELDDEKKFTVATTTFGLTIVGWILSNVQETWRGAQNCKKRSRVFDSTETHGSDRVSKKPKKIQKKNVVELMEPRELPTIFMDKVIEMGGREVRLVVQKKLSATDMNPSQSRLSIPKSQILQGFLSDQEIRTLDSKDGIRVLLIDPCLELHQGKTFSYVLTERWNAVAHPHKPNGLEKDAMVQLWSFRLDGTLRFCLTKV